MNKIFHTAIRSGDDVYCIDTIEHQGGLWLVPEWLEIQGGQVRKPERIIRLDCLQYQSEPEGLAFDYVLNDSIPQAVLDGQTIAGYIVEIRPDITFAIPNAADLNEPAKSHTIPS